MTLRLKDEPHDAARVGEQGRLCTAAGGGEALGQLRLLRGPAELPSVSLAHLRENGWVVLTELIHPDTCADLSASFDRMQEEAPSKGKRIGLGNIVNATPSVAKAAVRGRTLTSCGPGSSWVSVGRGRFLGGPLLTAHAS